MNTISNIGQTMATDGLKYSNSIVKDGGKTAKPEPNINIVDGKRVIDNIEQNMAETKASVQQLQQLSDQVMGRKVQFNVNKELGSVVVKIVDPSTNQVLKEIPSADIQKLKVNLRRTIGLLFDEMV